MAWKSAVPIPLTKSTIDIWHNWIGSIAIATKFHSLVIMSILENEYFH
ncbi:MAG: hypothetical protein V7K67_24485 [Nostoc sp.]